MSLNPSNGIAARANPQAHVFPNLARHVESGSMIAVFSEVDTQVAKELTEAGATEENCLEMNFGRKSGGTFKEVPTKHIGIAHGWSFERGWYYYVAKGPGIPPDIAEEFHKTWGTQVRVEGHCGCPSPLEWAHGFAIGSYHIDTQEGLNAFVALLATIDRRTKVAA